MHPAQRANSIYAIAAEFVSTSSPSTFARTLSISLRIRVPEGSALRKQRQVQGKSLRPKCSGTVRRRGIVLRAALCLAVRKVLGRAPLRFDVVTPRRRALARYCRDTFGPALRVGD